MNQQTNRASSPTTHTITPHLVVRGAAQAADWYQQAFGAQVGARIPVPGGKFIQIEVRLGDATVMLADEFPDLGVLSPLTLGGTYGALDIATEDADALWDRAVATLDGEAARRWVRILPPQTPIIQATTLERAAGFKRRAAWVLPCR